MDNGFSIAMTPVQLAAVMEDQTATGDSVSNRIWGGVGFLGSVLELASATALCLVPEPTGLTKAGCIVVGAHSLDGISSSAYQVYTGKQTASMTARATAGIASELGASSETAEQIGIAVDMVIPFAVAGAARVASVRMGQVKLMNHEAVKGVMGGGHTIKKHVGKTAQELLEKVMRGKQSGSFKPGHSASSFTSLEIAEKAVSKAVKANRSKIRQWAKGTGAESDNYLVFRYDAKSNLGIVVKYDSTQAKNATMIEVVMKKKQYNNKPYYIATAYPVL
ncbi:RNase A-like domain-containing protein [Pantoea sp. BAV 3049]|uniref:RNase A-like domain-containing protein n=1 Tax=Pantoea sp. BAV 3049 TaxID=2654188 RepID=UPI00131ECAB2|nr:RNase A-like domain-containing protein [Pantoea sp. BAV 3049]